MNHRFSVPAIAAAVRKLAPSGLFGAQGIWALGVHAMRSISFASKATIVFLMFALPIAWLSWSYFSSQRSAIEFSLKERDEVRNLQTSSPGLQQALTLRAAPASSSEALVEELDKAYVDLEKVQDELGTLYFKAQVDYVWHVS
jgi:hypothetical protein